VGLAGAARGCINTAACPKVLASIDHAITHKAEFQRGLDTTMPVTEVIERRYIDKEKFHDLLLRLFGAGNFDVEVSDATTVCIRSSKLTASS